MSGGMRWDKARDADRLKRPEANNKPLLPGRSRLATTPKQKEYIVSLRRELGKPDGPIPALRGSASAEIERLIALRGGRTKPTSVPPKLSQLEIIRSLSAQLGIDAPKPDTEAEARFVVDDLISRERRRRRQIQNDGA